MEQLKFATNKYAQSMSKWADDGISAVRFNQAHTQIDRLTAHPDHGDAIGTPSEYTRQNIISSIKAGVTFVTILKGNDDIWRKGQAVLLVTINGKEYLKTVDNQEEADSLGNLPLY